jgi:putative two-component system response regulator
VHHSTQSTLLIVDDTVQNLTLLGNLLSPTYQIQAATSGAEALDMASGTPRPDLILLDVMMPEMNGYETLKRLRADPMTRDIPVIFLTALGSPEEELYGLEAGAVDYIIKPIQPSVVRARVQTQIQVKRTRDWLNDQNAYLESEVTQHRAEYELIQMVAIHTLSHLVDISDQDTSPDIRRIQAFVHLLATRLREHPRFTATLTPNYINLLTRSVTLYDIGMKGIPDTILQKAGALTAPEWTIMQTHTNLGAAAIVLAQQDLDRPLAFLTLAQESARWHHERWDGGGYPDGLAGEAIPLSARLMGLADAFNALISPRVYKLALALEEARTIIADRRGTQFDPDVTDAFLDGFPAFADIARGHQNRVLQPLD